MRKLRIFLPVLLVASFALADQVIDPANTDQVRNAPNLNPACRPQKGLSSSTAAMRCATPRNMDRRAGCSTSLPKKK